LWGAYNKFPARLAAVRDAMLAVPPVKEQKTFDQIMLAKHLWPFMQGDLMEHDSYHCEIYPGSLPFPTQRREWRYCGWGPYKASKRTIVFKKQCPMACRPKDHPDWTWC
ncbi:uncharacterized protein LOC108672433, partial [Hyalella azteca]|uniref:Uncharacterized protein LOC108672433 n=1 Tax=Hyalella azteca TaxID=294128 RepID=A0A8B7NR86_HYAAZ